VSTIRIPVLLSAILLLSAAPAPEPDPSARILGAALTRSKAYETLAHLTDRIGPRLSGSAGLEKAIAWTSEDLRRAGLDRVWTEPVKVPHWVRGVETGSITAPAEHPLALTALGMSEPTPPEGVSGEIFEATSLDEVKNAGDAVRGKIVFYDKPIQPTFAADGGYGSVAPMRHKGASLAARGGAVGMLIRSLGTASFRLPHTGALTYEEDAPRIPAAAISAEDADLIHRLLAAGEKVQVRFTLGCKNLPEADSANVLAELRGSKSPNEIVLIGAHLDSWDLATGAIDDGAGVAIVMDTMRLLKALGLRPRRTIRAVLFTNEENGLAGGKAYAETHKAEIPAHVAAIETDSGGAAPVGFGVTAGAGGVEIVREIASRLTALGASDVTPEGGGADISKLREALVPVLSLRQDPLHYFDYHHSAADTLDKVNAVDLARNVGALAVLAWSLADRPEPLPRPDPLPPPTTP
jgi:carboxypeptidase Q